MRLPRTTKFRVATSIFVSALSSMILIGCASNGPADQRQTISHSVKIEVSGSERVRFTGFYGDTITKHEVKVAPAPAEFLVDDPRGAVFAQLRKADKEGFLKVRLIRGNEVIKEGETSAPYGTVNLDQPVE